MCHSLFEDYANGQLAEYELGDAYEDRYYNYMHNEFPPVRGEPLCQRYYSRGQELFQQFAGFPDDWEILGVELEVHLKLGNREFIGFIDLLVREQSTGHLVVIDHKSKGKFKDEEEQKQYAHQLYLYAEWVYQEYHEYPAYLMFNMFRVGEEVRIPFDTNALSEAKEWFLNTIDAIYQDVDFWDKITLEYEAKNKPLSAYKNNDFYCQYLCGSRLLCSRSGLTQEGTVGI